MLQQYIVIQKLNMQGLQSFNSKCDFADKYKIKYFSSESLICQPVCQVDSLQVPAYGMEYECLDAL
jgi:hypothetical protein